VTGSGAAENPRAIACRILICAIRTRCQVNAAASAFALGGAASLGPNDATGPGRRGAPRAIVTATPAAARETAFARPRPPWR